MMRNRAKPRAFTIIEIMIALSIAAIMMAIAMPAALRALEKDALRQAVSDVVEGCEQARATAILNGAPAELSIRAEDGRIAVSQGAAPEGPGAAGPLRSGAGTAASAFEAYLGEDVAIELIYVNLIDMMEAEEVRVRFYPNGTSDEFTVILRTTEGSYQVSLDVITGTTSKKKIR